ncbi:hypothetical protein [Haladaptatus sp. NG-SE-30]
MTEDNDTSAGNDATTVESKQNTDSTDIEPIVPSENALPTDDLQYPEFSFEEGTISPIGAFDLERELDREEATKWLRELAGGLTSHDVAVESPDRHVTFGVRPDTVSMAFDPNEDHRGTLEVTFQLDAKIMLEQDADRPKLGARGGRGFIPVEMLTTDRKPEHFRCYNWIEDPIKRE